MGLFDIFRGKSELEKLEEETAANPTPAALATLAERFQAAGNVARALETAKKAVETFPDSERARNAYQTIRRLQMQNRIVELQRRIENDPVPGDFEVLANLFYHDLGDVDKAMDISRRGLEKFPKSEGLHFLDGQIRFDRFHNEFIARDGEKCLEHLRVAATLNPQNYRALLLLARLYGELGLTKQAREQIAALRRIAPDDETVAGLEKALPPEPLFEDLDDALGAAEQTRGVPPGAAAVAALFGVRSGVQRPAADPARIQGVLKTLVDPAWALGAFAFTTEGQNLGYEVRPDLDGSAWQQALIAIHHAAEIASRRMDIGNFHAGTLDCPTRRIHIRERGTLIMALIARSNSRTNEVESALSQALESL
jgi:tetratricopeptide (TPR) repeat protein